MERRALAILLEKTLVGDKNDFKYLTHEQAGVSFEVLLIC